jgi:heat shock protein HtpX
MQNISEATMKFLNRSLVIFLLLYGVVFAIADACLVRLGAPSWSLIILPVVLVGFQFLIGPWIIEWILDISWTSWRWEGSPLPACNREFIEKVCLEQGIGVPRIGVIHSGTPNAFCYGHVPGNARLVVTTGLIDVLSPEEADAVIAHELGHIKHWDFVIMTLAAIAPMLLYQIYVVANRINNARVVVWGAYLSYLASQFVVLLLNRTREYYADSFSAKVTGAPDALASALIKIAYGMVRSEGEYRESLQRGFNKEQKARFGRERRLAGALGVMGISNLRAGQSLAMGVADPSHAAAVMRWDVVNPWARVYELNSTHPLTAFRVRQLNRSAETMNQAVRYPLPQESGMRIGWFPLELLLWAAPIVGLVLLFAAWWEPQVLAALGINMPANAVPLLLMFVGVAWMIRVLFRYHGEFQDSVIGSLIEDVEVSQMRPRAVRVKGEIVGKGVPGFFWSSDLVLRDASGIIFILYRQSIPLARFLFAIKAEDFIGKQVEIEGWFRRGMAPYIEMSRLTDESGKRHYAYSRWVQYALSAIAVATGYIWLAGI